MGQIPPKFSEPLAPKIPVGSETVCRVHMLYLHAKSGGDPPKDDGGRWKSLEFCCLSVGLFVTVGPDRIEVHSF